MSGINKKEYTKDPQAKKDYVNDWATYWLPAGDTITASAWTVASGLTASAPTFTTTTTTIWLEGGTLETTYSVSNRITTAAGRIEDRTFYVFIQTQ